MTELTEWFARVGPSLFRKTTNSPVHVLKGPLADLLNAALSTTQKSGTFRLDLEPLARFTSESSAKEAYVTIKESDLRMDGQRLAFSRNWSKLILLVAPDTVFKLDIERMERAVSENLRDLGFEGFFRALSRKGYSFIDRPMMNILRESPPPGVRGLQPPSSS